MPTATKAYLGDGVYIEHNDFEFILTTENGIRATNTIILEPVVMKTLIQYAKRKGVDIE